MISIYVARTLDTIGQWRERRSAIRRLSRLNDHLLRDIGIHRHEIASAVGRAARSLPVASNGHCKSVVLPNGALMALSCRTGPGRV